MMTRTSRNTMRRKAIAAAAAVAVTGAAALAPQSALADKAKDLAVLRPKIVQVVQTLDSVPFDSLRPECQRSKGLFGEAVKIMIDDADHRNDVLMNIDTEYMVRAAEVAICKRSVEDIRKVRTIPQFKFYYIVGENAGFGRNVPSAIREGAIAKRPAPGPTSAVQGAPTAAARAP